MSQDFDILEIPRTGFSRTGFMDVYPKSSALFLANIQNHSINPASINPVLLNPVLGTSEYLSVHLLANVLRRVEIVKLCGDRHLTM